MKTTDMILIALLLSFTGCGAHADTTTTGDTGAAAAGAGIHPAGAMDKTTGQGHGMTGGGRTVATDAHVEDVARAEGGYTVEELLSRSSELDGQQVKVRGRVVKFTPDIMGTNWMHIQDGTPGDLAVTSDTTVAKGDLVLVQGTLSVDRDFGAGYRYPAIIEQATVTRE